MLSQTEKSRMLPRMIGSVAILMASLGLTAVAGPTAAAARTYDGPRTSHPVFLRPPVYHRGRRDGCPSTGCPPADAHLSYGGGPVMHAVTVYTIFWLAPGYHFEAAYDGTPGSTVADRRFESLINRFVTDVGSTPFSKTLRPSSDQSGSKRNAVPFRGSFVDIGQLAHFKKDDLGTAAQPLMDSDIQAVIKRAAKDESWPLGSPNVQYLVFTPATVQSCYSSMSCDAEIDTGSGAYCAYHSSFAVAAGTVLYSNMFDAGYSTACGGPNWQVGGMSVGPYDGYGPNGDAVADYEINPASHEMAETVTDPSGSTGWYDTGNTNEIGDTCAYNFATLNPDHGDVVLHGDPYLIQQEWSNATDVCTVAFHRPTKLPVNSTADSVPSLGITPLCSNTPGGDVANPSYSLRCAIADADNDALAGTFHHVITFKKCSSCSIKLQSPLPAIQATGLAISGGGKTFILGRHAIPRGLVINGNGVVVTGLTVKNFTADGIDVSESTSVRIGGSKADTLTSNGGFGITVGSSATDSSTVIVSGNRIYKNARGGINLAGQAPGSCTAGLKPGAPNAYLPCPVIQTAIPGHVAGTASCNDHCVVQLFLVPKQPDGTNHGQAKAFIGRSGVVGNKWSIVPTVGLTNGERVTATVTDPGRGYTSEFSANGKVT